MVNVMAKKNAHVAATRTLINSKEDYQEKLLNVSYNDKLLEMIEYAEENDVPPYIIFGDKTLEQLVAFKPLSDFELEDIYGLGTKKIEKYGEEIMACIILKKGETMTEEEMKAQYGPDMDPNTGDEGQEEGEEEKKPQQKEEKQQEQPKKKQEVEAQAKKKKKKMGLAERIGHKPNQLSGGEKQRVAVARALINQPSLILADEPSGSLDSANKKELHSLLRELCNEYGLTILVVTHDKELAEVSDRIIEMRDGNILSSTTK